MKKLLTLAVATIGRVSMALTVASSSAAQVIGIHVQPLTRPAAFLDDVSMQIKIKLDGLYTQVLNLKDPSHVVAAKVTVEPGAMFPWLTHPGPVIVAVQSGALAYVNADDCVPRHYGAGSAFIDLGRGNVHTAYNDTEAPVTRSATFLEVPESGSLMQPAPTPVESGRCGLYGPAAR